MQFYNQRWDWVVIESKMPIGKDVEDLKGNLVALGFVFVTKFVVKLPNGTLTSYRIRQLT